MTLRVGILQFLRNHTTAKCVLRPSCECKYVTCSTSVIASSVFDGYSHIDNRDSATSMRQV